MILLILPVLVSTVLCAPTWEQSASQASQWNGPSQYSMQWQQNAQPGSPQKPSPQIPWQQPQKPAQNPWQHTPQPAQNSWQINPKGNQWQPQSNRDVKDADVNDVWSGKTETCQDGQFRAVESDPNQFEMCVNGHWVKKFCPPGTTFQAATMSCAADIDDDQGSGKDQGNNPWQPKQPSPQPAPSNPWQQNQQQWQQPQQPQPWQQKPAPQQPVAWQQPNPVSWQQMPQKPSPPQQSNTWQSGQPSQPAPWMSWQNAGPGANSWAQPIPIMPAPGSWNKQPAPMPWKQPAPTPAPTPEPTPAPATPAPGTPEPTTPEPTTTTTTATTTTATTTATTTTAAAPTTTTTFEPVDPWVHPFPDKCKSGTRRSVQGNNDAFEVCDNGEWVFMLCAPGTWFDTEVMDCSDGFNLAPAWPVPKDMMKAMNGQRGNMDQSGDSSTTNEMMINMMNMMSTNGNGQTDDADVKMQKFYTSQYGNADMMQQKMPDTNDGGMEMMQPIQMTGDDMMNTDDTQSDDMETSMTDPHIWLHDVREVIIVSVEKCKVGRTRVDDSASRYQECIMNPAGVTMWIRRKCAPGTHFSPWTRNCGKVTFRFNGTYASRGKSDVTEMKPVDTGAMPEEMMPDDMPDVNVPDTMMPDAMMPDGMMPDEMTGDNGDMETMPEDNQMNGDDQMMVHKTYNPWAADGNAPWNIETSDSGIDGKKKKQLTITFQLDRGY